MRHVLATSRVDVVILDRALPGKNALAMPSRA
jgi:hypothetical protein